MAGGLLVVFSGDAGTGKNAILAEVKKRRFGPKRKMVTELVSVTTRPRRHAEVEGRDYYFKSVKEFQELVEAKRFAEFVPSENGHYYGLLRSEIEKIPTDGLAVTHLDYMGGVTVKGLYPESRLIQVVADMHPEVHFRVIEERMRRRGDTESDIQKRLLVARGQLDRAHDLLIIGVYTHRIVNAEGGLAKAVEEACSIIEQRFELAEAGC